MHPWDKYSTAAPGQLRQYGPLSNVVRKAYKTLAARHGINPTTVAKWRERTTVTDAAMGPTPALTVLTVEQEAIAVAFRQHTLLPLDDCLCALQATIPQLARSALHRCF